MQKEKRMISMYAKSVLINQINNLVKELVLKDYKKDLGLHTIEELFKFKDNLEVIWNEKKGI
ncbi:MAG: hypothetical protein ACRC0Y_09000 [Fusobacteriaceae bacterium]